MIISGKDYNEVYDNFTWTIPVDFNIAWASCDKHADLNSKNLALIYENQKGEVVNFTFGDLKGYSNRAANMLRAYGINKGDRVAVLLSQRPETAITHLACFKIGAISVPIFTLFGDEAVRYRLQNSGAVAVVTDIENYTKIASVWAECPELKSVFLVNGKEALAKNFWAEIARASDQLSWKKTLADEPAFILYTSGTTGPPKGALHAHRTLLGHLTGFNFLLNFYGQDNDLIWSPADWAWIAGLMDVLFPSWYHGKPVLAFRTEGSFDPEHAFYIMSKHAVRNTLLVPTMLKMMRQVSSPHKVNIRSMFTGGEAVGTEILEWAESNFGIKINEGYGQTECNLIAGHVPSLMQQKNGSLGKATPGHIVSILDDNGNEVGPGTEGHIACKAPDPVMLLQYWKNTEATKEKYKNNWLITGDMAYKDDDGYLWFVGRSDDVITSSGYRIGPGPIEDCLTRHPGVKLSAVIGVPDFRRTEAVKAFVVVSDGYQADTNLEQELRELVRNKLAKHEYPREIEFVAELPMTTTGKVMRRTLKEKEIKVKYKE